MVTLAQRIEELRTQRGLSRPALAAALSLPKMSIEKFETGRQSPTKEQAQLLNTLCQCNHSYLLSFRPPGRGLFIRPRGPGDWCFY